MNPVLRKVDLIILHCSDSDVKAHDNIETIRQWHTQRGFIGPDGVAGSEDDVGYHYFINKRGEVYKGREEWEIGAHCKGHNATSIGICLGGKDEFKDEQFVACANLVIKLMAKYNVPVWSVVPHKRFDIGKTCPNFDTFKEVVWRIWAMGKRLSV